MPKAQKRNENASNHLLRYFNRSIQITAGDINIEKELPTETNTESDRMDLDELSPYDMRQKTIKQSIVANQFENIKDHGESSSNFSSSNKNQKFGSL